MKTLKKQISHRDGFDLDLTENGSFLFSRGIAHSNHIKVSQEELQKARRRLEDRLRKDPIAVFECLDHLGLIGTEIFK